VNPTLEGSKKRPQLQKADSKEDSWIWRVGPVGKSKMTDKDVEEWFRKGKR
jgi:hypothetical protein